MWFKSKQVSSNMIILIHPQMGSSNLHYDEKKPWIVRYICMSIMVQETCMVYLRLRGIITCDFCPTANLTFKDSLWQNLLGYYVYTKRGTLVHKHSSFEWTIQETLYYAHHIFFLLKAHTQVKFFSFLPCDDLHILS